MFTRGGVYRVVKEAMGGTLAKLSVSAGQYIVGLIAQTLTSLGHPWAPSKETINLLAAGIAVLITSYFRWRNIRGMHESSSDALRIMYVTTVMVAILIGWSGLTLLLQPETRRLPPAPVPSQLTFNHDAVGWLPALAPQALRALLGAVPPATSPAPESTPAEPRYGLAPQAGTLIGLIGLLIAFGQSILAMSGEESLAQVNRELAYPKHKNLLRAGLVIFVYSLLFTSLVSFFAYALIPDSVRPQYFDNLLSGIAMHLIGPVTLKLAFQGFIVVVGFLMLAGAVNTAIVGSNGVLKRVSEDGVLSEWFGAPHRRYGTTSRLISLITLLQLLTIIGSRGNVYVLGEAYAFGVVWAFASKALAVLVLRFKDRSPREWKVPGNLSLDRFELPVGLGVITALLFAIAGINLLTKEVATVSGVAFTLIFFIIFSISERLSERRRGTAPAEFEQFRLHRRAEVSDQTLGVRPGNLLCTVRDYGNLAHLSHVLERTDTGRQDVLVMTVRVLRGPAAGYHDIHAHELFTIYEQQLFSRVVTLAETAGKHVELLVVPSSNVFQAMAHTAVQLNSAEIVAGRSTVLTFAEQVRRLERAWEGVPDKSPHAVCFRVIAPDGTTDECVLGAHDPGLTADDIALIHRLWLDVTSQPGSAQLYHRDIVHVALQHFAAELAGPKRAALLASLAAIKGTTKEARGAAPRHPRHRWRPHRRRP